MKKRRRKSPPLGSRGLRSRGPAILEEGKLVGKPVMAEEVERPEVDLVGRDNIEILGVSTQPGPSSAQERREEVQQPGSPSVLMPTLQVINPALLPGYSVVKPGSLRPPVSSCRLHRPRNMNIIMARKPILAMNPLFLTQANSRISQRKRYRGTSLSWFRR